MEKTNAFQAAGLAMTIAATPVVASSEQVHVTVPSDSEIHCGVQEAVSNFLASKGLMGISKTGFTGLEEAAAHLHEVAKARIVNFMPVPTTDGRGYDEMRQDARGNQIYGITGFSGINPHEHPNTSPNATCFFVIDSP